MCVFMLFSFFIPDTALLTLNTISQGRLFAEWSNLIFGKVSKSYLVISRKAKRLLKSQMITGITKINKSNEKNKSSFYKKNKM